MNRTRPRPKKVELPADFEDEDGEPLLDGARRDVDVSDFYEMRFCEVRDCGEPLPLDEPALHLELGDRSLLVCQRCYDGLNS